MSGASGSPVNVRWQVTLMGHFGLAASDGSPVLLPPLGQRLVALLALRRAQPRAVAAGTLWPESSERRAQGSLRTCLWKVRVAAPGLVRADSGVLQLADAAVDAHGLLVDPEQEPFPEQQRRAVTDLDSWHRVDLLPGWYDDWVVLLREQLRQAVLHRWERTADELLARGRPAPALQAALTATALEPLRESAHRLVLRAHLAEGNVAEARRHYDWCVRLFAVELQADPSPELTRLLDHRAGSLTL